MNDQSKAKQIQSQEPDALRRRIEELQQAKLAWKREKEELKEIEKKYRLLADNISDVIFVLDMNLNYTYVSPSVKILRGYEPEEVLKQTTLESLVPASRELALKSLSEVMELEKSEQRDISISRTLQLELKRKDGTTVWTEVRFSFIRDEDQRPGGILGITRDITERKLVETTQNRLLYILESNLNEIYAFDSESLAFDTSTGGR
jgi:PAS domain S-box-containing protein